jgi:hypothetical protein
MVPNNPTCQLPGCFHCGTSVLRTFATTPANKPASARLSPSIAKWTRLTTGTSQLLDEIEERMRRVKPPPGIKGICSGGVLFETPSLSKYGLGGTGELYRGIGRFNRSCKEVPANCWVLTGRIWKVGVLPNDTEGKPSCRQKRGNIELRTTSGSHFCAVDQRQREIVRHQSWKIL